MDTVLQDLRYALRALQRSPGFTAVAVLTLALGIGANTAIFSVVDAVLLRALPYPDANRLVTITEANVATGRRGIPFSPPNFVDLAAQSRTLEGVGAYTGASFNLTGVAEPERLSGVAVTPSLLPTVGVQPLVGRLFTADEGQPGRGTSSSSATVCGRAISVRIRTSFPSRSRSMAARTSWSA